MPNVSIIIPVYQVEQHISRCLNSILAQTYQDFECICIDDGSKDQSGEICDAYAAKDSRIRVKHIANGGVSNARNTGLDMAKGKYIMFVDSDDWVEPNHIAMLLPKGDEDMVYCGLLTVQQGNPVEKIHSPAETVTASRWRNDFVAFWSTFPLQSPVRVCFIRSIIEENAIRFDPLVTIGEDQLFNLNYLRYCNSIRYTDNCTYHYEIGYDTSAMHRFHANRLSGVIKICQAVESITQKPELYFRFQQWHIVIAHFNKWKNKHSNIHQLLEECYTSSYFRECIPYIRQHGSLDEKIETYFMNYWLHPLFKPFYGIVATLSELKNKLLQ